MTLFVRQAPSMLDGKVSLWHSARVDSRFNVRVFSRTECGIRGALEPMLSPDAFTNLDTRSAYAYLCGLCPACERKDYDARDSWYQVQINFSRSIKQRLIARKPVLATRVVEKCEYGYHDEIDCEDSDYAKPYHPENRLEAEVLKVLQRHWEDCEMQYHMDVSGAVKDLSALVLATARIISAAEQVTGVKT